MNPAQATLEGRYTPRNGQVLTKEVNSEMVLVDMQRGVYHGLNAVGVEVWKQLDGRNTLADVIDNLHRHYPDVDRATIEADVLSLLQSLLDNELVLAK
jgi:hypothetical protein